MAVCPFFSNSIVWMTVVLTYWQTIVAKSVVAVNQPFCTSPLEYKPLGPFYNVDLVGYVTNIVQWHFARTIVGFSLVLLPKEQRHRKMTEKNCETFFRTRITKDNFDPFLHSLDKWIHVCVCMCVLFGILSYNRKKRQTFLCIYNYTDTEFEKIAFNKKIRRKILEPSK